MAKSIAARRRGDNYQARFLWLNLLKMRTSDFISSIEFESDRISFVDDVIVNYSSDIKDSSDGRIVKCDYFQCKYHVTMSGSFSLDNLLEPKFLNNKESMIKRLYTAFLKLKNSKHGFRLYIVSNWNWHPDDILASHLSEGSIRDSFYLGSERTKVGRGRKLIKDHIDINDAELKLFLDKVRFNLGNGLNDLEDRMLPLLKLASLIPIDKSTSLNPYDDLVWKWFDQGIKMYDNNILDNLLKSEKLISKAPISYSEISIKSFKQFAYKPKDTLSKSLDLTEYFDGRYIKDEKDWKAIILKIREFLLSEVTQLKQPIHFFFDCHLTICFLVGYLLNPKYGIQIIPVQKSNSTGYELWPIKGTQIESNWNYDLSKEIADEVILCISLTSDIKLHFENYYKNSSIADIPVIYLSPQAGLGPLAIHDGAHAWALSLNLRNMLEKLLPAQCNKFHLFISAPAAFSYILGNTIGYKLSNINLYEYDFEGKKYQNRYKFSFKLPIEEEEA